MYSRERLLWVAVLWLMAGALVFVLAPTFGAVADDRGCDSAPCAFPAENNIGGIILGTDLLEGEGLISFGVGDNFQADLAPDRNFNTEPIIGLGINDLTTGNFFIYKSWYYFDSRVGDSGERVPVNIWANATSASLSGSGNCGNGNANWNGHERCDFVANVSEGYMRYLEAETDCSSFSCGAVPDTITKSNYFEVNLEDDTCGSLEGLSNACLALIQDGGTCVADTCVETARVRAEDFMLKGHRYKAVRDDQGNDKTMTLNNFYLEMRYGKGYDRINVPQSQHPEGGDWAQPLDASHGVSAISVGSPCVGGGPNTDCSIEAGKVTDMSPANTYENVHQP